MNYLAALILIGVDYDEVMAFAVMDKLLREPGNWGRLYKKNLEMLFPLADHIYGWLLSEHPHLEEHFKKHRVPLATLLAGPFLSLFANIIYFENAM